MAVGVVAVGLQGIAVDEGAQVHRMRGAAHFMLDGEQVLAAVEIDDVLEAVLVLIVFLGDEAALQEALIRAGEVGDVDLDVVAVIVRLRLSSVSRNCRCWSRPTFTRATLPSPFLSSAGISMISG